MVERPYTSGKDLKQRKSELFLCVWYPLSKTTPTFKSSIF